MDVSVLAATVGSGTPADKRIVIIRMTEAIPGDVFT
tara:strand:+ start:312 stop:419 length:108 start_codon:yes stop_codon:yes gene_type:complete